MEDIKIRKIYIDSRFQTVNNKWDENHADFEITLPESIQLPPNCSAFMDDIVLPVAFKHIQKDVNDKLCVGAFYNDTTYYHVLTFPDQNYSLETFGIVMQELLRTTQGASTILYNVVTDPNKMNLVISIVDQRVTKPDVARFNIYTDFELKVLNGLTTPQSINNVLQNYNPQNSLPSLWHDEYVEFLPDIHVIRNIYITKNLSNYTVTSNFPWAGQTIVKKIPINVPYGTMLFNNVNAAHDYFRCGGQTVNKIRFTLRDSYGNPIKMSLHWSCSLIFLLE